MIASPETIDESGEVYPFQYAPTNQHGEVCGDYRGSLTLSLAIAAANALPFGGMVARLRGASAWSYNWGGGWADSESAAVALAPAEWTE